MELTPRKRIIRTVVILIGYQYQTSKTHSDRQDSHKSAKLPGILIDLYQAYQFALKMHPTKLAIITDIEHDQRWQETVGAMGKDLVNSDVLDFIDTIRKDGIYYRHRNKDWLESKIEKLATGADRLLIYYTGHGREGYLEMPPPMSNDVAKGCELGISLVPRSSLVLWSATNPSFVPTSASATLAPIIPASAPSSTVVSVVSERQASPSLEVTLISTMEYTKTIVTPITNRSMATNNVSPKEYKPEETDQLQVCIAGHSPRSSEIVTKGKDDHLPVGFFTNPNDGAANNGVYPYFLQMNRLRHICLSRAKKNVESLFLFDCCNGTGLGFPFVLRPDGVFRLADKVPKDILSHELGILNFTATSRNFSQSSSSILNIVSPMISRPRTTNSTLDTEMVTMLTDPDTGNQQEEISGLAHQDNSGTAIQSNLSQLLTHQVQFFSAQAICISSTSPRQQSLSTTDGSLFTQYLFKALSEGIRSLQALRKYIKDGCQPYSQTTTIHSTYPDLCYIWRWVYGGEQQYRVKVDLNQGLVILSSITTSE